VSQPAVAALTTVTVANPGACANCNCPVGQPTCDACFGAAGPCRCIIGGPGITPAGSGTASCLVRAGPVGAGGITYDPEDLNVIVSCPTGGVPLGTPFNSLGSRPDCATSAGDLVTATLTGTAAQCQFFGFAAGTTVAVQPIECVYITAA
jgi:hypothetical protein